MPLFHIKRRKFSVSNLLLASLFSISIIFAPKPATASSGDNGYSGGAMEVLAVISTIQLHLMNAQAIIGILNSPMSAVVTDDGMNNALTRRLLYAMLTNPGLTQALILRMSKLQKLNLRRALLEEEINQISALIDATLIIVNGLGATQIPENQSSRRAFILKMLQKKVQLKIRTSTNAAEIAESKEYLRAIDSIIVSEVFFQFVSLWQKYPAAGPKL